MNEIDDLGRCESCGKYVPEVELKSVEITDFTTENEKTTEYLWCKHCWDFLDSLLKPNQPTTKRTRPVRKTDV